MQKITIDAENKKIGRVASEAAKALSGKNLTTYARNTTPDISVEIINVSKADISAKRMAEEKKAVYSGYPGGLKVPTAALIAKKKGNSELFRKAVYGMLPSNKLRSILIKRLTISE